MIRLEDFPRPKDDNGRGIHWSASPYHLSGYELDYWMSELQAMGIKWVKVIDDGGGSSAELCRRLVDIGIMPVVRLYIGNPGHVQSRNLEAIRRLIDIGALYFETNNEPELAIEWEDGVVPRNWLDIVVGNFIIDASEIIGLGGYPAFPAMGVGTIVNPFKLIVSSGRQDLFENGAWLAIHNYVLNHPLDYPFDSVNQTGQLLTQGEYESDRWIWDNDPLSVINRLRTEGAKPGVTLRDDATCWLAYALWNEQLVEAFGHSVPIMSTEGGVVVGDRQDGRYGRNNVSRHEQVTLWIQDFLVSSAPTWYFTVFHWLIANNAMGQNRPGWETQCWYGDWWDKEFNLAGRLPVVDALKVTAPTVRPGVISSGVIHGYLTDLKHLPVATRRLKALRDGQVIRETESCGDGVYRFIGLPPGTYSIIVDKVLGFAAHDLTLLPHAVVAQDLQVPDPLSAVGGQLTDLSGQPKPMQTVVLTQAGQNVGSMVSNGQGFYGFSPLTAGTYLIGLPGAVPEQVQVDGQRPLTQNLVVPADQSFEFRVVTRRLLPQSESKGRHVFYGVVRDEVGGPIDGIKIEMSWTGAAPRTAFPVAVTGSDPGKPRGYFEFIHTSGEFALRLLDAIWPAPPADKLKTRDLPGQLPDQSVSYEIVFQLVRVTSVPADSVITGTLVRGIEGMNVILRAGDTVLSSALPANGSFRFDKLRAGSYNLEVDGPGVIARAIVVDGRSTVNLLPIDISFGRRGVIQGTVSDLTGKPLPNLQVLLRRDQQEIARSQTNVQGYYRFDPLWGGTYVVEVADPPTKTSAIVISGSQVQTVNLFVPRQVERKAVQHYVLFGSASAAGTRTNLRLAQRYVLVVGAAVGFDPGEAAHAERVTIIGDEQTVSQDTERRLREAGCEVGRLGGDSYAIGEAIARLLENRQRTDSMSNR